MSAQPVDAPPVVELSLLAIAVAERDAAERLLDKLESILTRIGGHASYDDQVAMRDARAHLVARGVRKSDAPPVWRDRG